ncbi:MAG: larA [Acidobacteria bacterium]|nr:larA [Acidobacteriota bacterium]
MATVNLAYGRGLLPLEVPNGTEVIEPRSLPGLPDERATVVAALRAPLAGPGLRELARGRRTAGISICDNTRPFPLRTVLPPMLEELAGLEVTLFVATGSHRACTPGELDEMLGDEILSAVAISQHDARRAGAHRRVTVIPDSGVPAALDAAYLDQDLRLTLGLIEPHFFAGFSGGPKMVAPGLASLETILDLHSTARTGHPLATWGVAVGNPIHDAIRHVAAAAEVHLSLDITQNREREITGVFAGPPAVGHPQGYAAVRRAAMCPVAAPFDVVVTTNGGYPLDQNLYQTVKGMSAAAQIVKPGGAILVASECSDGFPAHGRYRELLAAFAGPREFLAALPGLLPAPDLWQVQVQALVQSKARVLLHAGGLTDDEVRVAWLEPAGDPGEALTRLVREADPGARVAVLPGGPYLIPYLAD